MPSREPWGLVIQDDDRKQYAFTGVITDVSGWNGRVAEARAQSRNVVSFVHIAAHVSQLAEWGEKNGFACVAIEQILAPPVDRSLVYEGLLPKYAEKANRRRVVKVLCRGKCGKNRWAEMNVDYPGPSELKSAEAGVFTAKCLFCGYESKEPYNWLR